MQLQQKIQLDTDVFKLLILSILYHDTGMTITLPISSLLSDIPLKPLIRKQHAKLFVTKIKQVGAECFPKNIDDNEKSILANVISRHQGNVDISKGDEKVNKVLVLLRFLDECDTQENRLGDKAGNLSGVINTLEQESKTLKSNIELINRQGNDLKNQVATLWGFNDFEELSENVSTFANSLNDQKNHYRKHLLFKRVSIEDMDDDKSKWAVAFWLTNSEDITNFYKTNDANPKSLFTGFFMAKLRDEYTIGKGILDSLKMSNKIMFIAPDRKLCFTREFP